MRQFRDVADDTVAADVFTQGKAQLRLGPGEVRRVQDIPQEDRTHCLVRDFDAHGGDFVRDRGNTDVHHAEREREVTSKIRDPGKLHAAVQLDVIARNRRPANHTYHLGADSEALNRFFQPQTVEVDLVGGIGRYAAAGPQERERREFISAHVGTAAGDLFFDLLACFGYLIPFHRLHPGRFRLCSSGRTSLRLRSDSLRFFRSRLLRNRMCGRSFLGMKRCLHHCLHLGKHRALGREWCRQRWSQVVFLLQREVADDLGLCRSACGTRCSRLFHLSGCGVHGKGVVFVSQRNVHVEHSLAGSLYDLGRLPLCRRAEIRNTTGCRLLLELLMLLFITDIGVVGAGDHRDQAAEAAPAADHEAVQETQYQQRQGPVHT